MNTENKTFNIVEAAKAQKQYCDENPSPHFAPTSGRCWSCSRNIYEAVNHKGSEWNGVKYPDYVTGISVEKAGRELVTGCPHCNRSYCD
ncbi:hypothetical protein CLU96_1276 [Chryseobacterium sp. 52]|uniref:hypothetical protein n=1 Tax=Chryseobacterium sp. 52 TaxID=2035213 RepID=UPI000C1A1AD8|nr:hypothetical protein [Chryseobacterium sp. 52]PIF44332.1 hypothetical protein CLU96_1276 [Chryseobacterium sp. 52]